MTHLQLSNVDNTNRPEANAVKSREETLKMNISASEMIIEHTRMKLNVEFDNTIQYSLYNVAASNRTASRLSSAKG